MTEYVEIDWVKGRALRECLEHRCRCCGFRWETPTMDQQDKEALHA